MFSSKNPCIEIMTLKYIFEILIHDPNPKPKLYL